MTRSEIRELIEDVTNIVVGRVVDPLDHRLIKIETQMEFRKRRTELMWKAIALVLAVPSCIYTIINLVS